MKFSVVTAENTTLLIVVVVFGAEHAVRTAPVTVNLAGGKHGQSGRGEIHPHGRPDAGWKCRAHGAGRVHTHAGEWRFQTDEGGHQETGNPRRESSQPPGIGYVQ